MFKTKILQNTTESDASGRLVERKGQQKETQNQRVPDFSRQVPTHTQSVSQWQADLKNGCSHKDKDKSRWAASTHTPRRM